MVGEFHGGWMGIDARQAGDLGPFLGTRTGSVDRCRQELPCRASDHQGLSRGVENRGVPGARVNRTGRFVLFPVRWDITQG